MRKTQMNNLESRLTLVEKSVAYYIKGKRDVLDLYKCACGNTKAIHRQSVKKGLTKSCGCLGTELRRKSKTKHGMLNSREYYSWNAMINRCYQKNNVGFKNYGGRGIKVCKKWRNSFEAFYKDMGPRPKGHSLDRIDVNKGYSKSNCKWSSHKEQANNKRNTIFLTYKQVTLPLKEWAAKTGISYDTLRARIALKYSIDQIFEHRKNVKVNLKTHCKNGHEFTEDNTSVLKTKNSTYRRCIMCAREAQKRYKIKKGLKPFKKEGSDDR